jgi:Leucine-rich repeat (LRR) protein
VKLKKFLLGVLCAQLFVHSAEDFKKSEIITFNDRKLDSLPEKLAQCERLEELIVNNKGWELQNFSILSELGFLTRLDLDYCGLGVVPAGIAELPNLRALSLKGHNLRGQEESWNNLTGLPLVKLDLSVSHRLKKLPVVIGSFVNLQALKLKGCNGILDDSENRHVLGRLTSLINLNLSSTKLQRLPDELKKLAHLEKLNIRCNHELEIHEFDWQSLASLKKLIINYSSIEKLPSNFNTGLQQIIYNGNEFTDQELEVVMQRSPALVKIAKVINFKK